MGDTNLKPKLNFKFAGGGCRKRRWALRGRACGRGGSLCYSDEQLRLGSQPWGSLRQVGLGQAEMGSGLKREWRQISLFLVGLPSACVKRLFFFMLSCATSGLKQLLLILSWDLFPRKPIVSFWRLFDIVRFALARLPSSFG